MNSKNARIEKLWNKGIKDPKTIAKKLGLKDETRIIEGLIFMKLISGKQ